jgi:tape measure domain-containing protein
VRLRGGPVARGCSIRTCTLGQSISGNASAIERETRMLERATGLSRDHGQNMAALEKLYVAGKISADQYIKTVERLGVVIENTKHAGNPIAAQRAQTQQAIDTIGLPKGDKPASNGGPLGEMAAGAFGAYAGVEGIKHLAEIDDKYTELANKAMKFAEAGRGVNDILRDQRGLARELHQDLGASIDAYDSVRDATDNLNLTYHEQIRLTKTLSEGALLSGKGVASAGEAINSLSVAFEAGVDPGRALQTIFKQFPDLGDQITKSMGVSQSQLFKMGHEGELTFDRIARAMTTATKDIDEKSGKRGKTWAQTWSDFKDDVERPLNINLDAPFGTLDDVLKQVLADTRKINAAFEEGRATKAMLDMAHAAVDLEDQMGRLSVGINAAFGNDKWAGDGDKTGLLRFLPAGTKAAQEHASAVGEAKKKYDELRAAAAAGGVSSHELYEGYKSFATTLNGGELPRAISLLEEIRAPQKTFHEGTAALDSLFKSHTITLDQYTRKLHEIEDAYAGPEIRQFLKDATNPAPKHTQAMDYAQYVADNELATSLSALRAIEKYRLEIQQLKDARGRGAITDAQYTQGYYNASQEYRATDDYKRTQKPMLDAEAERSRRLTALRAKEMDEFKRDTDMKVQMMADLFAPVGDSLKKLFTTGKFELNDFASQMESVLADLAFKLLLTGGLGAAGVKPDIIKQLGGFAFGGDATIPGGMNWYTMPRAAFGYDAMVGGSGGTDSKIAMLRVSPGESLHVRTAEQRKAASEGGGRAPVNLRVYMQNDRRDLTEGLDSRDGERVLVKLNHRIGAQRKR